MKDFDEFQKHWSEENVEVRRFEWLTQNTIIIELEINLLSNIVVKDKFSVLEVGCGEGQNIVNLKRLHPYTKYYGVDISTNRVGFAKRHLKDVELFVQDGRELNFKDDAFDIVFCRDVLHHMMEGRERLIMEMYRVCKQGGKVYMIESNGSNLINIIFSFLIKKEVELKNITVNYVKGLLNEMKFDYRVKFVKGYNTQRLIFHYKYGIESMAFLKIGKLIYDIINLIPIPRSFYSYMIIEINK